MAIAERFQGANTIGAGRLSPYWGEHVARYVFALPFVDGKVVFDIACGTGYGLGFLKNRAKSVAGLDVDIEAVREALKECDETTSVIIGDGLILPFSDETFDVITSFETLEHLNERTKFLSELKRVLKPDGLLILSTPNAHYTRPINGKPTNPFHIYEYTPGDLRAELEEHFSIKMFLGQTLDGKIRIPPFEDAQKRMSKDVVTQVKLFWWKVLNKMPFALRESISEAIWKKPFYASEKDYEFGPETVEYAPVLVAVCSKE